MPIRLAAPKPNLSPLSGYLNRAMGKYRRVVLFRNGSLIFLTATFAWLIVSILDSFVDFPSYLRALWTLAWAFSVGYAFRRYVSIPWRRANNPMWVAERIEARFPTLKDIFSSAIEFEDLDTKDSRSSFALRHETLRRANRRASQLDIEKAIPSRGTKRLVFLCLLTSIILLVLGYRHHKWTEKELSRFLVPFGLASSEPATELEIVSPKNPHRMARGESLPIQIRLRGSLPERVTIVTLSEGGIPVEQAFKLPTENLNQDDPLYTFVLDSTRISTHFKYRVKAGRADSGWREVAVAPAPVLVPREGRPSPQIGLKFPEYTDLPEMDLPDGSSVISGVTGTLVSIRGATDLPIIKAKIGPRPETNRLALASGVIPFAAPNSLSVLALQTLNQEAWREESVTIESNQKNFQVQFIPRLPVGYALIWEDATGLTNQRMFDVRLFPDPSPNVLLERPSAQTDILRTTPNGMIPIKGKMLDKQYAIRNIWIEYRVNNEPIQKISLFDNDQIDQISRIGTVLGSIHGLPMWGGAFRQQQALQDLRIPVSRFTKVGIMPLKAGDVLTLSLVSDDHDNVTLFKSAGRSHEVEITITTADEIEMARQQAQAEIREELQALYNKQLEAQKKVQEVLKKLPPQAPLPADNAEQVGQAEQDQIQLRMKLLAEEGVLNQLQKWKQAAENAPLAKTDAGTRLEESLNELNRLLREELEPLEANLSESRRNPDAKSSLAKAEKRQAEVSGTLKSLIDRLEVGSATGEIRGEIRGLLGEVLRAIERSENLNQKLPAGQPQKLTPEQQAEIEKAASADDRIAEKSRQIIEKLEAQATARDQSLEQKLAQAASKENEAKAKLDQAKKFPPQSAEAMKLKQEAELLLEEATQLRDAAEELRKEIEQLRQAAQSGDVVQLKQNLRDAATKTRENQNEQANLLKKKAANELQKILESLEKNKADSQEGLTKKPRNSERAIQNLIEKQEQLQKKVDQALSREDPQEQKLELEKLAREQRDLERQTREEAQKLIREGANQSAETLRRAARQMNDAAETLERGESPLEKQDDILDTLDTVENARKREQQEEEARLQRENRAKEVDEIKQLREKQSRLIEEIKRLHQNAQKEKKWDRPLQTSLNDVQKLQQDLADKLQETIPQKFNEVPVYERMSKQAAEAMQLAAKRIEIRLDDVETRPFDPEVEQLGEKAIRRQQELALKRLDQLIDALKPDAEGMAKTDPPPMGMGGMPDPMPMAGMMGMMGMKPPLPPLAQLKALRSLQTDLAERTAEFDKAYPDRSKLNEDELQELNALQKAQADVAELLRNINPEGMPKENPKNPN